MTQHENRLKIVVGDITDLDVDAIVNAANSSLLGGGGVDGAIHRAAGPELYEFCRNLGGCKTGEAKITPGFKLPARHVIHTVGPVWQGGQSNEDALLANCYRNSFAVALKAGVRTIAFPAISTGIYRFPHERAATIALRECQAALEAHPELERVTLVCFDDAMQRVYRRCLPLQ
jgi:O-acetyl-ADP-ribose deacetylase (regulator of RNase III)